MNCANHPDRERVAFCQNCGKPLCQECVRSSGSAVLCEQCLAIRTAGSGYGAPLGVAPGFASARGVPNPTVAGLLGLIPGVGAMYNEQYAKGIVHLVVFAILVSLANDVNGIFGLFIAGWICYMAIEAHHTARAKRDGTPLPNPFGLNDIGERLGFGKAWPSSTPSADAPPTGVPPGPAAGFYPASGAAPNYSEPYVPPASHWGAPQDMYAPPVAPVPPVYPPPQNYPESGLSMCRRVPTGAIWLIGLGVFFLLSNAGLHILSGRLLVPFVLIGLGVATFVKRMTSTGYGLENDGTDHYRWRLGYALHGAAWLLMIGFVWLLHELHILRWGSSWPIFLIGMGVLLMVQHSLGGLRPMPPYPPQTPPSSASSTQIVPAPAPHDAGNHSHDDSQGSR